MTTLALEYFRSTTRYVGARTIGTKAPGLLAGPLAPLRLVNRKDPEPPRGRAGWARVRPMLSGICGSDLATIAGRSSFYFSPLVTMPFVPGHEVVGELLDDCEDLGVGTRVVLASVLACAARGEEPPCANCAAGMVNRCDRVTVGHLRPALQTGYSSETCGGWARQMVAHRSQLWAVPDGIDDRTAVLIEPLADAIHAALRTDLRPQSEVLVVGAGTVGLLTLLAVKLLTPAGRVTVAAKHERQRAAARMAGADEIVRPEHAAKSVRRHASAVKLTPERGQDFLLGGVDVAIECTGSRSALDLAMRTTRAGGRVVVTGIPGAGADLTPLWFRELELVGAYTSGTETLPDGTRKHAFQLALELASNLPMLADMVGATYPLDRWRDAIDHAMSAGKLGTFKVAFAPQD
ncbi:MAG: zinc-dependent alcohol dehydrogenase [Actinomycetota bacterium]